jgi:slime mold repeat-containing protein
MLPTPRPRRDRALFCLALLVMPCKALAADYFVAPDGNDDASGAAQSKPFRTLRRAVEAATQPGDTVWIRGGVYPADNWNNQLSLTHSGTATAPITFRNYPGELPILDGSELYEDGASGIEPVAPATAPVAFVRIIGVVARNWGTSGFSNGWPENVPNLASSNISFINCIADGNGVNGFSFAGAANVTIQNSIAAHNGARQPSWSSGFSLFGATGNNVLDGNVSFENIDVSARPEFGGRPTDGNGFILDEGTTHGYLVNNLGFRNGGACMKVTLSTNATLMNNTCVQNGQDANTQFNPEVYISEQQSGQGTSLRNNAGIAGRGQYDGNGFQFLNGDRDQANVWATTGNSPFTSITGALDFRLNANATQLINQGTAQFAPGTDIGFDPRCIRQQGGQALAFWQYALDYDYIASVGGVAGCFGGRVSRPAGGGVDIGAYERNGTLIGCSAGTECSDGNICTEDLCGAGRSCVNPPIEGCCTSDADCNDGDACTTDSCDIAAARCLNPVDVDCGENPTGTFGVNSYGYASVCNWGGYSWTYAGPAQAGVNATVSAIEKSAGLCYSGVVSAQENYGGIAMVGFNINQGDGANLPAENITLGGDGINLSLVNEKASSLRIQIQSAPDAAGNMSSWCVEVQGSGGFYPWSQFNTQCWSPEEGVAYGGEPVNVIAITVVGNNVEDREFAFCLNKITPSGDTCVGRPTSAPPVGDGNGGVIGAVDGMNGEGPGLNGGGVGVNGGEGSSGDPGAGVTETVPVFPVAPQSRSSSGCSLETPSRGSVSGGLPLSLMGLLVAAGAVSRRRQRSARSLGSPRDLS